MMTNKQSSDATFTTGNQHKAKEVANWLGTLNTHELVGRKAKLRTNTTTDVCAAELRDVNRKMLGTTG